MKRIGIVAVALLGAAYACVILRSDIMWDLFPTYYRSNDEMRHLQTKMNFVKRMGRVGSAVIALDYPKGQFVVLMPPKDSAHINAIMRSLRRMRVVRGDIDETTPDEIIVEGGGRIEFWGRFDPARAPVVSSFLRSDDLGKVVYDVLRHKGITPRRR